MLAVIRKYFLSLAGNVSSHVNGERATNTRVAGKSRYLNNVTSLHNFTFNGKD